MSAASLVRRFNVSHLLMGGKLAFDSALCVTGWTKRDLLLILKVDDNIANLLGPPCGAHPMDKDDLRLILKVENNIANRLCPSCTYTKYLKYLSYSDVWSVFLPDARTLKSLFFPPIFDISQFRRVKSITHTGVKCSSYYAVIEYAVCSTYEKSQQTLFFLKCWLRPEFSFSELHPPKKVSSIFSR